MESPAAAPAAAADEAEERAVFASVALRWRASLAPPTVEACSRWPDLTGRYVWREAALALVQLLCARPALCRGRAVLELAAGCAVPSAAAAALGARLVLATDAAEETLALASDNVAANLLEGGAGREGREDDVAAEAAEDSGVGPGPSRPQYGGGGERGGWGSADGIALLPPGWGVSERELRTTSLVGGVLLPRVPGSASPSLRPAAETPPPPPPPLPPPPPGREAPHVATALPHAARLVWSSKADADAVLARVGGAPLFDVVLATDALWLRPYSDDSIVRQASELFGAALRLARPGGGTACRAAGAAWTVARCCPLVLVSSERRLAGVGADARRAAEALGMAFAVVDARGVKDAATLEEGGAGYGPPAGTAAGAASAGLGRGYWLERSDGWFVGTNGGGRVCLAAASPCASCLARALAENDLRALSPEEEEIADERIGGATAGLEEEAALRRPQRPPSEAVASVGSVAHANPLWRRRARRTAGRE